MDALLNIAQSRMTKHLARIFSARQMFGYFYSWIFITSPCDSVLDKNAGVGSHLMIFLVLVSHQKNAQGNSNKMYVYIYNE